MAKSTVLDTDRYQQKIISLRGKLRHWSAAEVSERCREISELCIADWSRVLQQHFALPLAQMNILGSFGRGEGSFHSDLDLVAGKGVEFVESWGQWRSLRLRSVDDLDDLESLDSFYLASLVHHRHFYPQTALAEKFTQIFSPERAQQMRLDLAEDHYQRREKYDNISNYLQPNLKFQPGGLRDIDQSLCLCYLIQEQRADAYLPFLSRLEDLKKRLSLVRQVLHTRVASDVLLDVQQEFLADYFGFSEIRDFMSYISALCEESAFLCRLVFSYYQRDLPWQRLFVRDLLDQEYRSEDLQDLWQIYHLREAIYLRQLSLTELKKSKLFSSLLSLFARDSLALMDFLFDSRILDLMSPDFARVRNLVQHDQYHRYTVGAHTLVCLRRVADLLAGKFPLAAFAPLQRELEEIDHAILLYTALFHDLGKGLAGDHSELGMEIVARDLPHFTDSQALLPELQWMVKNHLLFSKAAFRTNLEENSIYHRLQKEELSLRRIRNLSLFTLVDISASNPEALTEWKLELLYRLYVKLRFPDQRPQERYQATLLQTGKGGAAALPVSVLASLDLDLVDLLRDPEVLKSEFASIVAYPNGHFYIDAVATDQFLLRFVKFGDEKHLFYRLLCFLHGLGLNILKLNANTAEQRIYDWVLLHDHRSLTQLQGLLQGFARSQLEFSYPYPESAHWNHVGEQWIVRAEGLKLTPLLLGLCGAVSAQDLNIEWVNIYRWGRQHEVLVGLSPSDIPPDEWRQRQWQF